MAAFFPSLRKRSRPSLSEEVMLRLATESQRWGSSGRSVDPASPRIPWAMLGTLAVLRSRRPSAARSSFTATSCGPDSHINLVASIR